MGTGGYEGEVEDGPYYVESPVEGFYARWCDFYVENTKLDFCRVELMEAGERTDNHEIENPIRCCAQRCAFSPHSERIDLRWIKLK